MINEIKKIIKNLSGRIITFGVVDKDLIDEIVNNSKLTDFYILSFNKQIQYQNSSSCTPVKKAKINKIKRKNKRKKFDYMIFEISDIKENINKMVYDSLSLTTKKVYFYGNSKDYGYTNIVKKYKRYGLKIKLQKYENKDYVIEIEIKKVNIFKKQYYKISDFIVYVYEAIGQALTS